MTIEYHEPPEELKPETREIHRALTTVCEELEAIDWYQHRLDVSHDGELRSVIEHNRNEEMEHAAMTLEWLRRRIPEFDEQLRKYLFTEGAILEPRAAAESVPTENGALARGLGVGSLRKRTEVS